MSRKIIMYTCIVSCVLYSRNSVVFVTIHLISRWYVITLMAIIGISCPTYLESRHFIRCNMWHFLIRFQLNKRGTWKMGRDERNLTKDFIPFEALNIGPVPDRIGFLFKVFHLLTSKDEMVKCGENTSHGKAGNIIEIISWMETYFLNFSSPGDYLLKLLIKLDLVWRLWQKLPPASKLLLTA